MNNFKSKDGITIVEVREELAKQKATIKRDKTYTCRRWIVSIKNEPDFYIRYIPTMGEMLKELKDKKVIAFCNDHQASTDGKTAKVRKEKKLQNKEIKTCKKVKKTNTPKTQELEALHVELVLQRMAIGISPEKKKELGDKLKALRIEIAELGGDHTIGGSEKVRNHGMTKQEMMEATQIGVAKKEAKKEKAKLKKNKVNVIGTKGSEDKVEKKPKVVKTKAKAKIKAKKGK